MARNRERTKGRRNTSGSFLALPHAYFQSEQYARLSARAVKLLVDMSCQYRGKNNGDLTATWSIMRRAGWTSKSQLAKGLAELEGAGWVLRTRQGSINAPTLYAITYMGIDFCGGKLDPGIKPAPMPLHFWKDPTYESTIPKSKRRVTAHRPDLDTGHAAPHGGSIVTPLRPHLPRTEGRKCA